MDVKFATINITCGQDGYGINFWGGAPVLVDTILPCSPAEQGGLMYGDILVELNGNDILGLSKEAVINAIKVYHREPLRIKVGRIRPLPITADSRKEAIQVIRNKVESSGGSQNAGAQQYKDVVKNSLLEVEDLLSSFDLSPLSSPAAHKKTSPAHNAAKCVSPKTTSASTKMSELEAFCQEPELQLYESDSLPSLPSSSVCSSEADPGETDERLDFSQFDDANRHNHSHKSREGEGTASFQHDEPETTRMMKMMVKSQQGIEGVKNIMQTVRQAKEEKNRKKVAILDHKNRLEHVSTVATFIPIQRERSTRDDRAGERAAAQIRAKKKSPHESQDPEGRRHFSLPSRSSMPRSDGPAVITHMPSRRIASPSKHLTSPTNNMPPLHAIVSPSPTNPNATSSTFAPNIRSLPPANTITIPHPFSEKSNSASTHTAETQSVEYPSRPQRHGGKVGEEPWVNGRGPDRPEFPLPHPTDADDVPSVSPSPPPVIPPYNPTFPDRFPLSNKEEYVLEYKKQTHSYEDISVNADEVKKDVSTAPDLISPYSVVDFQGGRGTFQVPVRRVKKRDPGDSSPGEGEQMDGAEEQHRTSVHDQETEQTDLTITDLAPLQLACAGLPMSLYEWRLEEVVQWLKQLSPALYRLYKSYFIKHDIIGRALLRLNVNKIHKNMGICMKHSGVLAAHIVQLKIRQERMELEELDTKYTFN